MAITIPIEPGALIGALVGGGIAKHQVEKNMLNNINNAVNASISPAELAMRGGHYDQVERIAQNTRVVFTPFNVIYLMKDGRNEVALDNIDTSEMTEDMRDAYRRKDENYFKAVLFNKIDTEVQFAEQAFARRMLGNYRSLQNQIRPGAQIEKQASATDVFDFLSHDHNYSEKLAAIILDGIDPVEIEISLESVRPLEKHASILQGIKGVFGKKEKASFRQDLNKPNYLAKNLRVGFLPDRVTFIVDGIMITQLPLLNMNDEGFEAFRQQDRRYFEKVFMDEMTGNIEANMIAKQAAEEENIFKKSTVHPEIYKLKMNKEFGSAWINFDQEVLIKEVEDKFGVDKINPIALNKLYFIQLSQKSMVPMQNHHVFEKFVRTMNDKPIDFLEREDNISLSEIVFALEQFQDLTGNKIFFKHISEAVRKYIADTLKKNSYALVYPSRIIDTLEEETFYRDINEMMGVEKDIVFNKSIDIIKKARDLHILTPEELEATVKEKTKDFSAADINQILSNVELNRLCDIYMAAKEKQYEEEIVKA